jgi:hypothetical protein
MRKALVLVGILFVALIASALLGATNGSESPPLSTGQLRALLGDEDAGRVAFALYQLAARGEVDKPVATRLCTHADAYVRRAAVFALGTTGDAASKAVLSQAVRDPDAGVRRAAVFALASVAGDDAVALIEGALSDGHPSVRELAAMALGRLGGKRAVESLIAGLEDPSLRVRRAAVVALGGLGDPAAMAPLQKLLAKPTAGLETRIAALVRKKLDEGHNFGYDFMTLPQLAARFSADTGIPTFVTDEALMAVAVAAQDPDNLDSLKVSMWHVTAKRFLDELTSAAGLTWLIEERWIVITAPAYLAYDTPLELEIAGALYRLGDDSAKATLTRFAGQRQWKARAEALLRKN